MRAERCQWRSLIALVRTMVRTIRLPCRVSPQSIGTPVDFASDHSTSQCRIKTEVRNGHESEQHENSTRVRRTADIGDGGVLCAGRNPGSCPKSGYVKANGLKYYYEISGKGEPLLLLHGGLGSIDMFRPIMPAFSEHRQIVAIDLQGHGRTELGSRKFGLSEIGDDVATVLTQLGFK